MFGMVTAGNAAAGRARLVVVAKQLVHMVAPTSPARLFDDGMVFRESSLSS